MLVDVEISARAAAARSSIVCSAVAEGDERISESVHYVAKGEPDNPNHASAPMPGKISSVVAKPGQQIRAGDRLVSIEAMKMEMAVYGPREATADEILVTPGVVVEPRDLLITLKNFWIEGR